MRPLLRLVSSLVFGLRGRTAKKLAGFALAEQGSLLTLRLAAAQTPDLRRRALYLRHAADEARHARMFLAAARARARREGLPAPAGLSSADAEDLFARLGEIGFLAFLHHAERRGRERFELYRDLLAQRGDRPGAALFAAILPDERRHEDYAMQELVALAGSPARARCAVLRARVWEASRAWRRLGRASAGALYAAIMTLVYAALFPLAWLTRRVRPETPGLRPAGEE
ncbi:hypothetical protein [Polyangium aurulentum]|uniref:hypothetical protein n=1 Tax=Polyangium aurulentum TaxID=2567896 RepID=UPI00146D4C66|nr:hypothetical protein [Polyangium aurulentum]UQA57318.1 hypothetical protein E8A73_039475 [Polyangium aurulentum]